MNEEITIKVSPFVIEVEGVKFSTDLIKRVFNEPIPKVLMAFERDGDQLKVSRFDTAEAAAKYFDEIIELRKT